MRLLQLEAADGVFTDAAEVEGAVVFDDVGDLGVAVGWAVLEVFDDFALGVQTQNKRVTFGCGLEEFRETSYYFAGEWVRQQSIKKCLALTDDGQPEFIFAV